MCCKGGCPHPHYVFSLSLHFVKPSNWCGWHKLLKLTNHRVYQEVVYQNEVLKTLMTGSTFLSLLSFPVVFMHLFSVRFSHILEPGTGLNSLRPNLHRCILCACDKPTTHIVVCILRQPQVVCRFDLYNPCHRIIVSTLHASKLDCTISLKSLKTLSKLSCNKSHRFWLPTAPL